MQLLLEVPDALPDSMQLTHTGFATEARMAMAVKLFELGRISSGQAAQLCNLTRFYCSCRNGA
jgi:predicted HTH domain antitoxin